MSKAKKPFPVGMFVDQVEGKSNVRRLQVELFDRRKSESAPEQIEEGSLEVRPHLDGEAAPDCLEITDEVYAGGKATFKVAVKEEFVRRGDFLAMIQEPILYEVEAKPKAGKGSKGREEESLKRLLDIRITVAAIHWKWWTVTPERLPESAPEDAEKDTPIRLDPDGESGFRLELWVREFNPRTGEFEDKRGEHDFTHWLAPEDSRLSLGEVAAMPLPWESGDPHQDFSNWWSAKNLTGAGAAFDLPCDSLLRVTAYPKHSIRRRFANPPFMVGDEPRVASLQIDLHLEHFTFELWRIDGESAGKALPLSAVGDEIPAEGYKVTLKIFDGEKEAAGVKVRVALREDGIEGREALGEILRNEGGEDTTREDGTLDFFYRPAALRLKAEHLEAVDALEECVEVFARRNDRCRERRIRERAEDGKGADAREWLGLSVEPELRLLFCKGPFLFNARDSKGAGAVEEGDKEAGSNGDHRSNGDRKSNGDREPKAEAAEAETQGRPGGGGGGGGEAPETALAPYEVDLTASMTGDERKSWRRIVSRGGKVHLVAGIDFKDVEAERRIRDASWLIPGEVKTRRCDRWLEGERREVCVLEFPDTGHAAGPVGEPLDFEKKNRFRMLPPVEAALERIERVASAADETFSTDTIGAKGRAFIAASVGKIGEASAEELERETESFLETLVTVSHFLAGASLSKEALEVSFELQGGIFERFRDRAIGSVCDILTLSKIEKAVTGALVEAGSEGSAKAFSRLTGEFLENGRESALRLAGEFAQDLPKNASEAARAALEERTGAVREERRTLKPNAESANAELTALTETLMELARRVAPLREAKGRHEERLQKLREELPALAKAQKESTEELEGIRGRIKDLGEKISGTAKTREKEERTLESLRKNSVRLQEIEKAAEEKAAELARVLAEQTEEATAAKGKRDAGEAKVDQLKKRHDGLEEVKAGAQEFADAKRAEIERIQDELEHARKAREAAIGRHEGLEQKLADRNLTTKEAKREAELAAADAARASGVVEEKRAGRQALVEEMERLTGDAGAFEEAERQAREALDAITKKLNALKDENEGPPNLVEVRGVEKDRVEISRAYEKAREELSDYRLKGDRSKRAVEDADRTIAGFVEREEDALKAAEEGKEALAKAKGLQEEQATLVTNNTAEQERLTVEVASLEAELKDEDRASDEAAAELEAKVEAVAMSEGAIVAAAGELVELERAWEALEATRIATENAYSRAARNHGTALAESEGVQRQVAEAEKRLRNSSERNQELHEVEVKEVGGEREIGDVAAEAAEKLSVHEEAIQGTIGKLEEVDLRLEPLETKLTEAGAAWKEARAAERDAAEKDYRKDLEEQLLEEWREEFDSLKDGVGEILEENSSGGSGEMSAAFDALAEPVTEAKRLKSIERQVARTIEKRRGELDGWIGSLEGLPEDAKEVIGVSDLVGSWEEPRSLGEKETPERLAKPVEMLWAALDEKVRDAQKARGFDLAGGLEEVGGEAAPRAGERYREDAARRDAQAEALEAAAGWIGKARGFGAWVLEWLVPDMVSGFFSKVVLAAAVEAFDWIHGFMGRFSEGLLSVASDPDFCAESELAPEARAKARGFVFSKKLCDAAFFNFEAEHERRLIAEFRPEKLRGQADSDGGYVSFTKKRVEEATRRYESYYPAQRGRATAMFERLCLDALDPQRLTHYQPLKNLRQRREVAGLLEKLTADMEDFRDAIHGREADERVAGAAICGLAEGSRWNSRERDLAFEWIDWLSGRAIRLGALAATPFTGGKPVSPARIGEAIEGPSESLRTACAALFAYPRVIAYQHDIVLAQSLAYQALFEGYVMPSTGEAARRDPAGTPPDRVTDEVKKDG